MYLYNCSNMNKNKHLFCTILNVIRLDAWRKLDSLARANPDIQKLTAMMKECAFIDDSTTLDGDDNAETNNIIMNNVNNFMAVDDNEDR